MSRITRRQMIAGAGVLALGATPVARATVAPMAAAPGTGADGGVPAALRERALAAFARHRASFSAHDVIGIADYAAPSRDARFYILDLASGRADALLVAHGRGSDPGHSGWLQHFSNTPGSAASSAGTYLTAAAYTGSHGASRRLVGLDPQNDNAEARAIVVHPALYVSAEMVRTQGKLGRSEGCFAFSERDIGQVLARLGEGRMIYADKV